MRSPRLFDEKDMPGRCDPMNFDRARAGHHPREFFGMRGRDDPVRFALQQQRPSLDPQETFSGSIYDRKSRAHAPIFSNSLMIPPCDD
jgi:hypothetical protein